MADNTQRFSSRVDNYVKYRPTYPPALITTLADHCQLTPASVVADIGAGTGLLSQRFLEHGNQVFAVEPNREMREAGAALLNGYPNFVSVDGTAEATTLPDSSVDFVSAGQAFHWFDQAKAHTEFRRILRADGWVVLVWNYRRVGATPFMTEYEELIKTYSTNYGDLAHHQPDFDDQQVRAFFGIAGYQLVTLLNEQRFDLTGLQGRLLSSSYAPEAGHPNHEPMLAALQELFAEHQQGGIVSFEYDTKLYYGQLR